MPHREANPDPEEEAEEAIAVIDRTTQEAIVVTQPDPRWVGPVATTTHDHRTGELHRY